MRAFDLAASLPWAIRPDALQVILDLAARAAVSPETVAAAMSGSPAALSARLGRPLDNSHHMTIRDGVAVMPVNGPIMRYAGLFSDISGATSSEILARDLAAALDDPAVTAILLEVDSPGGEVAGTAELASMIRAANERKPVWAYVDSLGASAAYWLSAAAERIVVAPTAILGSIGVVSAMPDPSKTSSKEIEFVSSQSPKKRANVSTEAGRAQVQAVVDALADVFVADVATYRGVSTDTVLSDFGQGDVFVGQAAVAAGLADAVGNFEATVSDLAARAIERNGPAVLAHAASSTPPAPAVAGTTPTQEVSMSDATVPAPVALTAEQANQFAELQTRNAELQAKLAATQAAADANAEQSKLLADRVKAMETDARRKRFTDEVMGKSDASAIRWFGETAKHVSLLEHLADTAGEDSPIFTGYVTQQRALAEQMRSSKLFEEIGASGGESSAATAWDRVEAEAKRLTEADSTLSLPAAVDRVLATNKKLAAEYVAEVRGASR